MSASRLHRELGPRNRFGALLAILSCPCHVVMLLFLTAGTGLGAWLAAHSAWLYGAFAFAFTTGLWLMFRRERECESCAVPDRSVGLRDHR